MRAYQVSAVVLAAAALALVFQLSLAKTQGLFVYTLDDPYIHLAVAENILRGGYGVNLEEYSSPSSSVLYPLILALGLAFGIGNFAPLAAAGTGALISAWLIAGLFWRYAINHERRSAVTAAVLLLPALLLAINIPALVLTGMEHTLHAAASLAVIAGLAGLQPGVRTPVFLLVAIFLTPLLRFEGVALAGAAIVVLAAHGRLQAAAFAGVAIAAALGLYAVVMNSLGLPLLPSSVLTKSPVSASALDSTGAETLKSLIRTAMRGFEHRYGTYFVAGMALIALAFLVPRNDEKTRLGVAFAAAAALAAHLLAGDYGWFGRYEVYAVAILLATLAILFGPALQGTDRRSLFFFLGTLGILAVSAIDYASKFARSPSASENIYVQQYQMHRFATEYFSHPVAVNDLGLVAFENDNYVLDLWGLGSETVRKTVTSGGDARTTFDSLSKQADVKFAMLYEAWFGNVIPEGWCKMGVLETIQVVTADADVAFYLVDPAYQADMEDALASFAKSLPAPAVFKPTPCSD